MKLFLFLTFINAAFSSMQLRTGTQSSLRINAKRAPPATDSSTIPELISAPTAQPPKCPEGSTCTFVHYWEKISQQFCKGKTIQANAINVCAWISQHCVHKSPDTPLVPENDPSHVCAARHNCVPDGPKECFDDVWCQCNHVDKKKKGKARFKFTSEEGCNELTIDDPTKRMKSKYCKWKDQRCHKHDGPPAELVNCPPGLCPTSQPETTCAAGQKYSQITPPGLSEDTTLIGFCCGTHGCVKDSSYCAPDLCVTTCADGKIFNELSPPSYDEQDEDTKRCCGTHACVDPIVIPSASCETCTELCVKQKYDKTLAEFKLSAKVHCKAEENKEDGRCLLYAKCTETPVTPVTPVDCPEGEIREGDDCVPETITCDDDEEMVHDECVSKCEADEIRDEAGNCGCKEGDEKVGGTCVKKCGENENRDNAGACQTTPVPCAPDEERISGICIKRCGEDENRVDGVCINPDCVDARRQRMRGFICGNTLRWGWMQRRSLCVTYRKCLAIIIQPTVTCNVSPICEGLGRQTIMYEPCNRCGTCKTSVGDVCPNDSRNLALLAIVGAGTITMADQESQCLCKCKSDKCTGEVILYKHGAFNGKAVGFKLGDYNHAAMTGKGVKNDDVSSLKVPSGCKVTLFQHGQFGGWHATFPEGEYNHAAMLRRGAKNDDMSSLKIVSNLKPANDPSTCAAPQVFKESTCSCGCENGAELALECEGGARGQVVPLTKWDHATCSCKCDASSLTEFQVQSASPQCAVTCKPDIIANCETENKLPSADCSKCQCAADSPVCEAPMVRGDNCDCVCPVEPTTGRSAADVCTDRHAVLDPQTCGCTCPNPCEGAKVHPNNGDCNTCQCPQNNDCSSTPPIQSILSETTCLFECDQTVLCPGNQNNLPLQAAAATNGAPAVAFLQTMADDAKSVCQCGCQCDAGTKEKCDRENKVFNALSCSCDCPKCGENMITTDQETCKCSCDEINRPCASEAQSLKETETKDSCQCSCPQSLIDFVQANPDFMMDESTCAKDCSDSVCENELMERSIEQDCKCQCKSSTVADCADNGGKFDAATCACTCMTPAAPFKLKDGAVYPDCGPMECVADPNCVAPLGLLDVDNHCTCTCSEDAIDKCVAAGKGEPAAPNCGECGKCMSGDPPKPLTSASCSDRQVMDHTSCKCKCQDATALMCPEGSTGIDQTEGGTCGCLCPQPTDAFMTILDPEESCNAVCSATDSCGAHGIDISAETSDTITTATKASKCECSCKADLCHGLDKSKPVWVSDGDKSKGCHCVCPTEPEQCEVGKEWDEEKCQCVCSENSCNCGDRLTRWQNYCSSVGMIATDRCGCECSTQDKAFCAARGDLMTSTVEKSNDGRYSCDCKCKNWETECPGALQIKTDEKGRLPPQAGGSIDTHNSFVDHLLKPAPAGCTCACPADSFQALVDDETSSPRAKMVANDATCKQIVCPQNLIDAAEQHRSNPLHMFNANPKFCKDTCVTTACPAGKARKAFPNCECSCPSSSPVCHSGKMLSSDCSSCECIDKEAPFRGMIQNPATCGFTCRQKECPAGSHTAETPDGCNCVCNYPDESGQYPNMIQGDPELDDTCAYICNPELPLTKDGLRLYRFEEPNKGCGYLCDESSDAAKTCHAKHQEYGDLNGDGQCACTCAQKQCESVPFGRTHIQLVNRMRTSGQCNCACPLNVLEEYAGGCPGALKLNRNNCQCQCPNMESQKADCINQGKAYDDYECKCKEIACPGRTVRGNNGHCFCPRETLPMAETDFLEQKMQQNYEQNKLRAHGSHCQWDCAPEVPNEHGQYCVERGGQLNGFPKCSCTRPATYGTCRKNLGSSFGGGASCAMRSGCNNCVDTVTNKLCTWHGGRCRGSRQ